MKILNNVLFRLMISVFFVGQFFLISCGDAKKPEQDSAVALEAQGEGAKAEITFEKTSHNFGQIYVGEIVTYTFTFTNTGTAPLLILDTFSGCGCTVGDYSRQPIAPGEKGRINVQFNSAGRSGYQSQIVMVMSNASQPETRLHIIAEVAQN